MTVIKKMLSTEMLPQGLDDRQHFLCRTVRAFFNIGELDPASDVPFRAAINSIHIGTTLLGHCDGTVTTVRISQVLATNDDRYRLARNTGVRGAIVIHRGRDFTLRPGALAVLKLDEPFFSADGSNQKRFTNVHLPMATLRAMVPGLDDMVGRELASGGALSLAMDYSEMLLKHPAASMRRASRLRHTCRPRGNRPWCLRRCRVAGAARRPARRQPQGGADVFGEAFCRAGFFCAKACRSRELVGALRNELLYEAGASFTARLNELRLRKAAALRARGERRASDIAFDCDFNDLSYFNRCFRRRFGLTPTAARGR